jgi:hypothetical protein
VKIATVRAALIIRPRKRITTITSAATKATTIKAGLGVLAFVGSLIWPVMSASSATVAAGASIRTAVGSNGLTSGSHATAGGVIACVAVTEEVLVSATGVSGFDEVFCSCAACWTDSSFDPVGRIDFLSAGALASALVFNHVLAGAEAVSELGAAAPLTGTGGNSLGARGVVGSPELAGTGAARPAGLGPKRDGIQREGDALASPAGCCTDQPGPALAAGESASGIGGEATLTGAAAFTEGVSLGTFGEAASPRLTGIGVASPARFGPMGDCVGCEDDAGRFLVCPGACAN